MLQVAICFQFKYMAPLSISLFFLLLLLNCSKRLMYLQHLDKVIHNVYLLGLSLFLSYIYLHSEKESHFFV